MGRIDALVLDRAQRPIGGLRVDDFLLRQDGRPIPIHNLSYEDLPVDVLLVLDVSASMRGHIQSVSAAAHQALAVLGDQDRVGIMVFDTRSRLQLPFRQDRALVERELDDVVEAEPFDGGTNIDRALLNAAAYVEREGRPKMRHAIVIVTDDQALPCDQPRVLAALDRADAVLMVLLSPAVAPRNGPYLNSRGRQQKPVYHTLVARQQRTMGRGHSATRSEGRRLCSRFALEWDRLSGACVGRIAGDCSLLGWGRAPRESRSRCRGHV
jgi:VWFA-related protein